MVFKYGQQAANHDNVVLLVHYFDTLFVVSKTCLFYHGFELLKKVETNLAHLWVNQMQNSFNRKDLSVSSECF